MEGKTRRIFPVIINALIVFVVNGVVIFTNIGLRADFVARWLKAFITAGRSPRFSHFSPCHMSVAPPKRSSG